MKTVPEFKKNWGNWRNNSSSEEIRKFQFEKLISFQEKYRKPRRKLINSLYKKFKEKYRKSPRKIKAKIK
jgi:hypothetical protein